MPEPPDGKFHVLVAEEGSRLLGYAAGRVQPDGEGYLDYIAVPDAARGRGTGRDLMVAIGRYLVIAAPRPASVTSPSRTTAPPPAASTSPSASDAPALDRGVPSAPKSG